MVCVLCLHISSQSVENVAVKAKYDESQSKLQTLQNQVVSLQVWCALCVWMVGWAVSTACRSVVCYWVCVCMHYNVCTYCMWYCSSIWKNKRLEMSVSQYNSNKGKLSSFSLISAGVFTAHTVLYVLYIIWIAVCGERCTCVGRLGKMAASTVCHVFEAS